MTTGKDDKNNLARLPASAGSGGGDHSHPPMDAASSSGGGGSTPSRVTEFLAPIHDEYSEQYTSARLVMHSHFRHLDETHDLEQQTLRTEIVDLVRPIYDEHRLIEKGE